MKFQYFSCILMLNFLFYSCDGMYDNVDPYYNLGEINYIAKVDSVSTMAGKNRVQIKWMVNTDPRIKELYATWNDVANEINFPIDFKQLDENRYYTVILDPVEEGCHIFYLYHLGNGDMSVSTEIEANSYGEQYHESLMPRSIRTITMEEGIITIFWRTAIDYCEVELTYTNIEGYNSTQLVCPTEISTVIEDALPGGAFNYVSTYLPEIDAIDDFSVHSDTMYFPE